MDRIFISILLMGNLLVSKLSASQHLRNLKANAASPQMSHIMFKKIKKFKKR
jgi:hypothetical protein